MDISHVFSAKDIITAPGDADPQNPGFGPRSALQLLRDEDRDYGYVVERGRNLSA